MGYSYNEYYEDYKDDDFKEKLNYYKTKGVTVDDAIWQEFSNRGSEAAYATKQKDSCDEQIKRIKEEDQIGRMSEELSNMRYEIRKLKQDREKTFFWEFRKRKDLKKQLESKRQMYKDKNRRRHKLKDDLKDYEEKSKKFEEQIATCKETREKIKKSVNNQINRLNRIESILETKTAIINSGYNPFFGEETNNALDELKKSLAEARKIELHPSSSKIEELNQKLNTFLNLEAMKHIIKKVDERAKEKAAECDRYIEDKKVYDLEEQQSYDLGDDKKGKSRKDKKHKKNKDDNER